MASVVRFRLLAALAVIAAASVVYGDQKSDEALRRNCEEIKRKLKASGSKPLWEPNCDNLNGVYKETVVGLAQQPRHRGAPRPPPKNRIVPRKPGEKQRPAHQRAGPTIPLPAIFDPRDVWGKKCPSFGYVYNQGTCNNCWAIAATSVINHRTCMHSQQDGEQIAWSLKQMTTCATGQSLFPRKCEPGYPTDGLEFWQRSGVLTDNCQSIPPNDGDMIAFNQTTCGIWCDNGMSILSVQKSFGGPRYEITSRKEHEIMGEIYLFGPVIAGMNIWDDFRYYKGGIYKHELALQRFDETSFKHAVVIHGWGIENGVKYWLVANSWGLTWGERGYFKILRGANECDIETYLHTSMPIEGLGQQPEEKPVEKMDIEDSRERMEID